MKDAPSPCEGLTEAHIRTAALRVFAESMVSAGLEHLVLSPGSRSTPLVCAFHHLAQQDRVSIHDIIDERSAGFFALGLARSTGFPPLLLCTSGSAMTHYFSAVVEAEASRLPMLIISADRPPELHGCGANQTMHQEGLYGIHAKSMTPHDYVADVPLQKWQQLALDFMGASLEANACAVHLNMPFRKPLEPQPLTEQQKSEIAALAPVQAVQPKNFSVADEDIRSLSAALQEAKRPLLVFGVCKAKMGHCAPQLDAIVEASDAVVGVDALSHLRRGRDYELFAWDALQHMQLLEPDLIVHFGDAPVCTGLLRFLTVVGKQTRFYAINDVHTDPYGAVDKMFFGDPVEALVSIASHLTSKEVMPSGSAIPIKELRQKLNARIDTILETFGEAKAVRLIVDNLPEGMTLCIGNSLAPRHLNRWCPVVNSTVLSQRGLSGIDGLIAGAAANASLGRPTLVLLGDTSLRHDIGSLSLHGGAPLIVVVLNNGGGRIFDELPIAQCAADGDAHLMEHFTMDPDAQRPSFRFAAQHAGMRFEHVHHDDKEPERKLAALLNQSSSEPVLIEITVPQKLALRNAQRLIES